MSKNRTAAARHAEWGRQGVAAAQAGDLTTAGRLLERATRAEPRHAPHWINLAQVRDRQGDIETAMAALTKALRADPASAFAARRLSALLRRYRLSSYDALDAYGLKAALVIPEADAHGVATAAVQQFKTRAAVRSAFSAGRDAQWLDLARSLIAKRTDPCLKDDLILATLTHAINTDPDMERLLGALRRAMLELEPERFLDRALTALACALIAQGTNTDYVLPVSQSEADMLAGLHADTRALLAGDAKAARTFLLVSLYRPFEETLGVLDPEACGGIRLGGLRELVAACMRELAAERAAAESIPTLSRPSDDTSERVASQYRHSPYPRWTSLQAPDAGAVKRTLTGHIGPDKVAFLDGPFDVLIAGAGTGHHAIASALAYGPKARVLAIDLSRPSLAYATRKASEYGAVNLEFMQADLLDLGGLDREFHVIEAVGVLHHLTDPFEGWRRLVGRLRAGGAMLVGLYSTLSRAGLAALREEPGYPGPDCSDDAARAYRALLRDRQPGGPADDIVESEDFYTLNTFRDLALHTSEAHLTLPEIARFLDENGLAFRGFVGRENWAAFAARFPDDPFPGALANWATYERENPRAFDAMYEFWCEKT